MVAYNDFLVEWSPAHCKRNGPRWLSNMNNITDVMHDGYTTYNHALWHGRIILWAAMFGWTVFWLWLFLAILIWVIWHSDTMYWSCVQSTFGTVSQSYFCVMVILSGPTFDNSQNYCYLFIHQYFVSSTMFLNMRQNLKEAKSLKWTMPTVIMLNNAFKWS